jgi:hypothetical protein
VSCASLSAAITVVLSWDTHTMTLIGILVLIAIIWLVVVLVGGLPTWLLLLLIVLLIVWFVGGRGRTV